MGITPAFVVRSDRGVAASRSGRSRILGPFGSARGVIEGQIGEWAPSPLITKLARNHPNPGNFAEIHRKMPDGCSGEDEGLDFVGAELARLAHGSNQFERNGWRLHLQVP